MGLVPVGQSEIDLMVEGETVRGDVVVDAQDEALDVTNLATHQIDVNMPNGSETLNVTSDESVTIETDPVYDDVLASRDEERANSYWSGGDLYYGATSLNDERYKISIDEEVEKISTSFSWHTSTGYIDYTYVELLDSDHNRIVRRQADSRFRSETFVAGEDFLPNEVAYVNKSAIGGTAGSSPVLYSHEVEVFTERKVGDTPYLS